PDVQSDQHRDRPHQGGYDEQTEQCDELHAWVDRLQQTALGRDVLREQRLAHHGRRPVERLRDEVRLLSLADTATRAQPYLGLEQPVRRAHDRVLASTCGARRRRPNRTTRNTPRMTPAINRVPTTADT